MHRSWRSVNESFIYAQVTMSDAVVPSAPPPYSYEEDEIVPSAPPSELPPPYAFTDQAFSQHASMTKGIRCYKRLERFCKENGEGLEDTWPQVREQLRYMCLHYGNNIGGLCDQEYPRRTGKTTALRYFTAFLLSEGRLVIYVGKSKREKKHMLSWIDGWFKYNKKNLRFCQGGKIPLILTVGKSENKGIIIADDLDQHNPNTIAWLEKKHCPCYTIFS
jgi:hypothetical protein